MDLAKYQLMQEIFLTLLLGGPPFLIGLFFGRKAKLSVFSAVACVVFMLPAAYMLVQSELHGSSCPGGECIADGLVLVGALIVAMVPVGYLVGSGLHSLQQLPVVGPIARVVKIVLFAALGGFLLIYLFAPRVLMQVFR